jgi:hypothetical protein
MKACTIPCWPLVAASTLALACASDPPEPLPAPVDPTSCGLGLSLELLVGIGPIRSHGTRPQVVLFVQMKDGETLEDLQHETLLIPSTFVRGDYVYLVNVPPGTYAAVAAVYIEDVGPTDVPITVPVNSNLSVGYELELSDGLIKHRSYFSRDMVAKSLTTVAPGSFAFMGSFEADQGFLFGEPDEMQLHFLHVLEGADVDRSSFFADMQAEGRAHCLELHSVRKDSQARLAFCDQARKTFLDTGWVQAIEASQAR